MRFLIDADMPRSAHLFNAGIAGIEQADAIVLIGTNPRREAALVFEAEPARTFEYLQIHDQSPLPDGTILITGAKGIQ